MNYLYLNKTKINNKLITLIKKIIIIHNFIYRYILLEVTYNSTLINRLFLYGNLIEAEVRSSNRPTIEGGVDCQWFEENIINSVNYDFSNLYIDDKDDDNENVISMSVNV